MHYVLTGLMACTLAIGLAGLTGCESTSANANNQNQGYAGGNGMYGEDPAQPGEHSAARFQQSAYGSPANNNGGN